eukprot:g79949.t1
MRTLRQNFLAKDHGPEQLPLLEANVNRTTASIEQAGQATGEEETKENQNRDITFAELCAKCAEGVRQKNLASWGKTFLRVSAICFFLFFFLFSLDLMSSSFSILGGCSVGGLFNSITNPIAGLLVGVLATVLVQSSSTSTSIVVSLVGSGGMSVRNAIPVIMGANIGTSVTNTIVSMGQIGDAQQFERAFAGATVHDMFNFLTVAVLLPVELTTRYLERLSGALTPQEVQNGQTWHGPVKALVSPLANRMLYVNTTVTEAVSLGKTTCPEIYSVVPVRGFIGCHQAPDFCPVFYTENATQADEMAAGGVCLFLALCLLVACLVGLVNVLQSALSGVSEDILRKATQLNPVLGLVIGCGITILVQSSSVTTSVLTPLVGLGIVSLEAMYVLTLGANIGTTATSFLAAMG